MFSVAVSIFHLHLLDELRLTLVPPRLVVLFFYLSYTDNIVLPTHLLEERRFIFSLSFKIQRFLRLLVTEHLLQKLFLLVLGRIRCLVLQKLMHL